MSKEELKKYVEEYSGKVLELKVYGILRKNGYFIAPNLYYDKQTFKYREVDFITRASTVVIPSFKSDNLSAEENITLNTLLNSANCHINLHLVIECKQSPRKSWVFLDAGEEPITSIDACHLIKSDMSFYAEGSPAWPLRAVLWKGVCFLPEMKNDAIYSRYFAEGPKQQSEKEQIFQAITEVTAASDYVKHNTTRTSDMSETDIYIPMIIIEGDLFSYNLKTQELKDIQEARLIWNFGSQESDISKIESVVIPVISSKYADEFISRIYSTANENLLQVTDNVCFILRDYGKYILQGKYPKLFAKLNNSNRHNVYEFSQELFLEKPSDIDRERKCLT